MNIGDIKKRKKSLGITTAQLAMIAELPVGTVSKVMTGETKNPSYITIEKLEKAILAEEMRRRIDAYRKAIFEYLKQQGLDEVDGEGFEKIYRDANNLDDAPIPFAKPIGSEIDGNVLRYMDDRISVSVMRELTDDRYIELLDGHLVFSQAPNLEHQTIVQKLGTIIDRYIDDNNGKCRMYNVGVNVRLADDYNLLIPDVAVVCDDSKLTADGIDGAPDWIVEVVSKSTRHIDYHQKMHKYMGSGVREYWIVDPEKKRTTVYINGEPMLAYIYDWNQPIPVNIYEGQLAVQISNLY